MIETNTTWADTGYDCDHCGGRILKRTDHETGQPSRSCFQCEQCSCQWTLKHRPLRVGTLAGCRTAQRDRDEIGDSAGESNVPWLLIAIGAVVLLALLRLGGAVLGLLVPAGLILIGGFVIVRYGRGQGWW